MNTHPSPIISALLLLAACGATPGDSTSASTSPTEDAPPSYSSSSLEVSTSTTGDAATMGPATTNGTSSSGGSATGNASGDGSTGELDATSTGSSSPTGDEASTGAASTGYQDQVCFGDACEVDADCGPNFVCLEHPHAHTLMCVAGCFGLGGCGDILASLNCGAFAPQEPLAECLKTPDGRACFPRPCDSIEQCPAKAIACIDGMCF